jgi:hypothetical protein
LAPPIMFGRWNGDEPDSDARLGEAVSFSNQDILGADGFDTYGDRMTGAEEAARSLSEGSRTAVESVSLAKPVGAIDDETPPHAVAMVLPVFSSEALYPVSIDARADDSNVLDYRWYCFLTEYLPALGTVDSLDEMGPEVLPDPSHWEWFLYYHNALLKLDNPDWRQMGIDWLDTPTAWDEDGRVIRTNEDSCDDWPPGGNGRRYGPDILH